MREAVTIFDPNSLFGNALLTNKDTRINFEVNPSQCRTKASATISKWLYHKKR